MWLKEASRYRLIYNGKRVLFDESQISFVIKQILKKSLPVQKIFNMFEVSIDNLDNLKIEIVPLDKKYALTDIEKMQINKDLLQDEDFFEKYEFVFVHEIIHFLTRKKEEKSYFNDAEEVNGFILGIAHYLSKGKTIQEIWKDIFPKIKFHFHKIDDAEAFFNRCISKARKLL